MTMAICCLGSGCSTSQHTVDKWQSRVNKWLPEGISHDDARRIMVQHGFRVYIDHPDDMDCDKKMAFHLVDVGLSFTNGKLTSHSTSIGGGLQF